MFKKIICFLAIINFGFIYSQQSYYNNVNINLTGLSLKNELANKITESHTQLLDYSQIWDAVKVTDINPENSQEVILIYGWENGTDSNLKNDRSRDKDENGASPGNWNREHVYSQSLGNPSLGETGPGADAHHLRPADKDWNSTRNNRKFTDGTGTSSGTQSNGGWYPGDEWKGDVARMMMYMYVRYGERCLPSNIGFGDNSATPDDMIDLFLEWNAEDPVSNFEVQRNTYHENINNENAQGNRNPFIDNPRLATRIWGGPLAEDIWGIYSGNDNEAPTAPTNLTANSITTYSVDLSWSASSDNEAVTSYDIYLNGSLVYNTDNTNATISDLDSNTSYSVYIIAKDIVDNESNQSNSIQVSTLEDTEAPTIPSNIVISNQTTTSFVVSWDESTDNTAVTSYDLYLDDSFLINLSETSFTVTNLEIATTYSVQILAKDEVGNESELSDPVDASTNGNNASATEIFFSEYIEGSSHNKALELVNLTTNTIDLTAYSIKKQSNGGKDGNGWDEDNVLSLAGYSITSNSTFVIINGKAEKDELINNADLVVTNNSSTDWGAPLNFNGNDPIGLFKNDVLIDIIGTFNGGDSNFAKDKTLRRKDDVISPNITFNKENEWDEFSKDNVEDIGKHNPIVLSSNSFFTNNIKVYPNPAERSIFIDNNTNSSISNISVINILGKRIIQFKKYQKEINIEKLPKGIYMLIFAVDKNLISKKFIKK